MYVWYEHFDWCFSFTNCWWNLSIDIMRLLNIYIFSILFCILTTKKRRKKNTLRTNLWIPCQILSFFDTIIWLLRNVKLYTLFVSLLFARALRIHIYMFILNSTWCFYLYIYRIIYHFFCIVFIIIINIMYRKGAFVGFRF